MTPNTQYYLSATPGAISASVGAYKVGTAVNATNILIDHKYKTIALTVTQAGITQNTAGTDAEAYTPLFD
jgi:hypothetical protein